MIEPLLLNYGILGIWVVVLLKQQFDFQSNYKKIIENNTNALTTNTFQLQRVKEKLDEIRDIEKFKKERA